MKPTKMDELIKTVKYCNDSLDEKHTDKAKYSSFWQKKMARQFFEAVDELIKPRLNLFPKEQRLQIKKLREVLYGEKVRRK